MSTTGADQFTDKEKVQILLHEYDARCAEILNRTSTGFQLVAVAATLFVLVMTVRQCIDGWFWFAVAASLAIVSIGGSFIFRDINKAARRIRELEKDINTRAGEDLLVWETTRGGAVTGYLR